MAMSRTWRVLPSIAPTKDAAPVVRLIMYKPAPNGVVNDANAVPVNPEMSSPTRSLVSTPRDPTGNRVPVFGETGGVPGGKLTPPCVNSWSSAESMS
jgi:hypothetical protein